MDCSVILPLQQQLPNTIIQRGCAILGLEGLAKLDLEINLTKSYLHERPTPLMAIVV